MTPAPERLPVRLRRSGLRLLTAAVAALMASALPHTVLAQDDKYPGKPITLVVPGTLGGSPDTMARLFAQKLSESMGQQVIVDTVGGASGVIGTMKVVRAKPDGYTVLYGFNQLVTMNPHLVANLPYSVEKDLVPVTMTTDLGYVWIANNSFAPNNMAEWIALAKAQPGKISFGTTGPGSAAHLGGEMLMERTGIQLLPVPYKGNSTSDLLAGVIHLKMEPYTTALPLIEGGKVKAIAVTGSTRLPQLPNVATVAETVPEYVIRGWQAVWVPAGTPPAIVNRLNAEFAKATKSPDVIDKLKPIALRPVGGPAAELQALTQQESRMWAALIKARNIKTEP